MGRRGPKPKPDKLKERDGVRKSRRNPREPKPPTGAPAMPAWLSAEAKAEWRRIVPQLAGLGLLALVDRGALAAYCTAFAELRYATQTLEADGSILDVPIVGVRRTRDAQGQTTADPEIFGYKKVKHPAVALQRDAMARVKAFLGEFGLSPAARAGLHVPQGKGPTAAAAEGKARFFKPRIHDEGTA
jgi:P27 family predicted phage terminase small subunit